MLRITEVREQTADGRPAWTFRLEGSIEAEWVEELRRVWRRRSDPGARVRVVLADVCFVDRTGKNLLREMHGKGVEILATDSLTALMRDEIVAPLHDA